MRKLKVQQGAATAAQRHLLVGFRLLTLAE